ncbi:hypothetical protein [Pseudomonas sp. TWP3-1]|uniref:hypothetical protein n=1 Tax=Pseudomonas sp. TWP3-1 TaxID=2804631 RepID=UPI003CE9190F
MGFSDRTAHKAAPARHFGIERQQQKTVDTAQNADEQDHTENTQQSSRSVWCGEEGIYLVKVVLQFHLVTLMRVGLDVYQTIPKVLEPVHLRIVLSLGPIVRM